MKATLILVTLLTLSLGVNADSTEKGVKFFHGTWEEAKAKAKAENKNIFVDFYATWCGPCKWMSKEVFTDSTVGHVFSDKVIAFKVDAENEEPELVASMNIEAYPTLALFDGEGKLLVSTKGAMGSAKLIEFVDAHKGFEEKEKAYRNDPQNIEKFKSYKDALAYKAPKNLTGEVKVFLENLPTEQLKTAEAWSLISEHLDDPNSNVVTFVFKNASWYKTNVAGYQEGFAWFINTLMTKAADSAQRAPMLRAQQLYLDLRKSTKTMQRPEAYYQEAFEIAHFKNAYDTLQFANHLLTLLQKYHAKDGAALAANVQEIIDLRPTDKKIQTQSLNLARRARQLSNTAFTTWVLAYAEQVFNTAAPDLYKKYITETFQKLTKDKLNLSKGNISLTFEEADKTISTLYTNFD